MQPSGTALAVIQSKLEHLYDVNVPYAVGDFVLSDAHLAAQLGNTAGAQETLFIREAEDALELSLYLDDSVLARVAKRTSESDWDARELNAWWQALEGVSHFVCAAWRAEHKRRFSALELELQAEVDKFILTACLLGDEHGMPSLASLRHLLFQRSHLRQGLTPALQARYSRASRLAGRYCQQLQKRHRVWPLDAGLLTEVRRFFRYDQRAKERHILRLSERPLSAWAS